MGIILLDYIDLKMVYYFIYKTIANFSKLSWSGKYFRCTSFHKVYFYTCH